MADLHDEHSVPLVLNAVDDAVVTLPNPVLVPARQLLAPVRPGLRCEDADAGDDLAAVFRWESLQLFDGRRLDEQAITFHAASGL